jgi:hypothetical protein
MKLIPSILFLFLMMFSFGALANCINDQSGNVVCGGGQCEVDQYGKVYCAQPGGGAVKDDHGNVQCGAGYCERDSFGKVWCSRVRGGGAKLDDHGVVQCLGGCEPGTPEHCSKASH